jgi:hypothetical protein
MPAAAAGLRGLCHILCVRRQLRFEEFEHTLHGHWLTVTDCLALALGNHETQPLEYLCRRQKREACLPVCQFGRTVRKRSGDEYCSVTFWLRVLQL